MKRRIILLAPLLALFAFVATTEKRVEAADVATLVEGEKFATKPAGSSIISGAGYSGGAALKFTQNNTASHTITCSATCDVVLMASGGQSGGQPTLRVNGSPAQALTSTNVVAYTFDVNLPAGQQNTINVTAGNTGTGRNAVLDVVTFPASDGGGTDADGDGVPEPPDNCPNVYNPQQETATATAWETRAMAPLLRHGQRRRDRCRGPVRHATRPGSHRMSDRSRRGGSWNCTGNQITPGEDHRRHNQQRCFWHSYPLLCPRWHVSGLSASHPQGWRQARWRAWNEDCCRYSHKADSCSQAGRQRHGRTCCAPMAMVSP